MRSVLRTVAFAVSAWLALAPSARADVQVSLRNGRVTIVARDATVRQILAEWARVGRTKMVNADRIPGGPLTLELRDVPEAEALDVLLRSLNGYFAAPRTALVPPDASVFESIVVMPTVASAAPRTPAPAGGPAPFAPAPTFNQNEEDQDNANVRPGGNPAQPPQQPVRPPIFSTFPTPQQGNQNNGAAVRPMLPSVRPGVVAQPPPPAAGDAPAPLPPNPAPNSAQPAGGPRGVSAPGMIAPAPGTNQPGQTARPQE
ncbi:MAG TPA: hypothetical protein VN628_01130 [Vicinamibacterales bacterium]|nr:hypothetical protein [Vicinamibacterales bacterium]